MDQELLGTGISVAELILAIIGLGGGGYAGAATSARARMRLEDRRKLLDVLIPRLEFAMFNYEPVALGRTIREIANVIEVLPWADRESWRIVRETIPLGSKTVAALNAAWVQETAEAAPSLHDEVPETNLTLRVLQDTRTKAEAKALTAENRKAIDEWYKGTFKETPGALDSLKGHLRRNLRTNLWRRVRAKGHNAKLAYRWVKRLVTSQPPGE